MTRTTTTPAAAAGAAATGTATEALIGIGACLLLAGATPILVGSRRRSVASFRRRLG